MRRRWRYTGRGGFGSGRCARDTEGYRITAQSKRELVQGLMMAVEQRRVTWPAASIQETGVRSQKGRDDLSSHLTSDAASAARAAAMPAPEMQTPAMMRSMFFFVIPFVTVLRSASLIC
jgi:hypothetical protein